MKNMLFIDASLLFALFLTLSLVGGWVVFLLLLISSSALHWYCSVRLGRDHFMAFLMFGVIVVSAVYFKLYSF